LAAERPVRPAGTFKTSDAPHVQRRAWWNFHQGAALEGSLLHQSVAVAVSASL
jgi:hypothetical protein